MPDQAKSKKRKLLPKFGLKFLLLLLLIASLPFAWLASVLNEYRNENRFIRTARAASEASEYDSFCTKWYDYELHRTNELPIQRNVPGWIRAAIGDEKFARIEKLRFEGNAHLGHIDLSGLKYVKHLSIEHSDIKDLQDIGCFDGLESLSIIGCNSIESLSGVENFRNLKSLSVMSHSPLKSLEAISGLEKLEELSIKLMTPNKTQLAPQHIQPFNSLPNLKFLAMNYWPSKDLSPLRDSVLLDFLSLENCWALENFDGIESGKNLTQVSVIGAPRMSDISALRQHNKLRWLTFESCSVPTLAGLANSKLLDGLTLKDCNSLRSLEGIQNGPNLKTLSIQNCRQLSDIQNLETLSKLERLSIINCKSLDQWQPISKLSGLIYLSLSENPQLTSLDFVRPLSQVISLSISKTGIRNFTGLETLNLLKSLKVQGCMELKNLNGLPTNDEMESFNLSGCSTLESLKGISNLASLVRVDIRDCKSLRDISDVGKLKLLNSLQIMDCKSVEDWTPLSDVTNLKIINLRGNPTLVSAEFLKDLTKLETAILTQTEIQNCQGMENLKLMSKLELQDCKQLVSLKGLPAGEYLRTIDIKNCTALKTLDGLEKVVNLRELYLNGCSSLTDFSAIKKLFGVWVSPTPLRKKLQGMRVLPPMNDY